MTMTPLTSVETSGGMFGTGRESASFTPVTPPRARRLDPAKFQKFAEFTKAVLSRDFAKLDRMSRTAPSRPAPPAQPAPLEQPAPIPAHRDFFASAIDTRSLPQLPCWVEREPPDYSKTHILPPCDMRRPCLVGVIPIGRLSTRQHVGHRRFLLPSDSLFGECPLLVGHNWGYRVGTAKLTRHALGVQVSFALGSFGLDAVVRQMMRRGRLCGLSCRLRADTTEQLYQLGSEAIGGHVVRELLEVSLTSRPAYDTVARLFDDRFAPTHNIDYSLLREVEQVDL